jgi:hypothetical protein
MKRRQSPFYTTGFAAPSSSSSPPLTLGRYTCSPTHARLLNAARSLPFPLPHRFFFRFDSISFLDAGETEFAYTTGSTAYTLKWTFHNELGLVFVAVYQRILQLTYVDDLLAGVVTHSRVSAWLYEKVRVAAVVEATAATAAAGCW